MEEQKNKEKVISFGKKKEEGENTQRYSYEELNRIASELHQQLQNQEAYIKKLQNYAREMEMTLQSRRMDYLMKVVELSMRSQSIWRFSEDFVQSCIEEIQELLTADEKEDNLENK